MLICDDHAMVREMLGLGLTAHGLESRSVGPDPPEAVIAEARHFHPDVVLLDLNLQVADGLDLIEPLCVTGASVLVLTGSADEDRLGAAVALGAVGYAMKGARFADLVEMIRASVCGQAVIGEDAHRHLVEVGRRYLARSTSLHGLVDQLTAREREVLGLLAHGHSVPEIATKMTVSVTTVRSYVRNILAKLRVSSQLAAVAVVAEVERHD